jgi:hypothetical protein
MEKKLIENATGIEAISEDNFCLITMTFNGKIPIGDLLYNKQYPKLSVKVMSNDFHVGYNIYMHECSLTEIANYDESYKNAFYMDAVWIHLACLTPEERIKWLIKISSVEEPKRKVQRLINKVSASIFNTRFHYIVEYDKKYGNRVYIQVSYNTECTKTGKSEVWHGRKFYLSDHMTDDEIIKTAYVAFKMAVEHEVMEGFKVNNTVLFNPHTDYKALLSVSDKEVKRR